MNARIGLATGLFTFFIMATGGNLAFAQANVPTAASQSPRTDKISAPDHPKKKIYKLSLPHHNTDPNEDNAVPETIFVDKSWLVSEEASLTKIISTLVKNDKKTMSLLKIKLDKKKTPFGRISLLTNYIGNLTK